MRIPEDGMRRFFAALQFFEVAGLFSSSSALLATHGAFWSDLLGMIGSDIEVLACTSLVLGLGCMQIQ